MARKPMKNLLFILPVLCAVFFSCCPFGGAAGDSLDKAVGEVLAGMMIDGVMIANLSMQAYYAEYDRWTQEFPGEIRDTSSDTD